VRNVHGVEKRAWGVRSELWRATFNRMWDQMEYDYLAVREVSPLVAKAMRMNMSWHAADVAVAMAESKM
jgi:hypothetical protein